MLAGFLLPTKPQKLYIPSMDWNTITVQQYQDIYNLNEPDDFSKSVKIVCILYGMTEAQVEDMDLKEFNDIAKEAAKVLNISEMPGKVKAYIKVGKTKYHINYQPSTLKLRQFVELQSFTTEPIKNMHLLMASIVEPVKWGFIPKPNNVDDHEKYATDMLNAKLIDVYHASVFFCKVYRDLISYGRNYLEADMVRQGMSMRVAKDTVTNLINTMDGFIPQNRLQNLKGAN